jgi:hypothetical protein
MGVYIQYDSGGNVGDENGGGRRCRRSGGSRDWWPLGLWWEKVVVVMVATVEVDSGWFVIEVRK